MQKKLIALAITAAFASAPAFADTSVYGLVDGGFGSKAVTAIGAPDVKTTTTGITYSQDQTTRFGVKSTEDLGNGMKAGFQVEMGLNADTAVSVDRVLAGSLDFGQGTSLTIGKMSSPFRGIVYGNDAMYGANFVGNLLTSAIDKANGTGLNQRVIAADVAQNFGAVKASLGLLNNTVKKDGFTDAQSGNGVEVTAVYNQNPLSVSGGYRTQKTTSAAALPGPGTDFTDNMLVLAAGFDFGVAKLSAEYGNHDSKNNVAGTSNKYSMETVGVNAPFTSDLAGYVQVSAGKHDLAGGGSNNLSAYGVGLHYDMSKHTFGYAHFGSSKEDNVTKTDQFGFGLVHSF
jgi:GBP family porin